MAADHTLPPLAALRALEAVVRLGSVTRAAEELGRTHGALSKQLKALQADLGRPLFDRAGTGLKANAAAIEIAGAVRETLDKLGERYAALARETRAPEVHVACSASFAMGWLVPHLPGFSAAHPDIRMRLSMTSAREMRAERDADLVVLWDRSTFPPDDQARAIRLGDSHFGIVAAPDYPVDATERDRLAAPCQIRHDHTARAWDIWSASTGIAVATPSVLSFPHSHLCIGAATAGMGIAIAERRLAASALDAGRLVTAAPFVAFPDGFAAIPRRAKPMTAATRLFVDWLGQALGAP